MCKVVIGNAYSLLAIKLMVSLLELNRQAQSLKYVDN